MALAVDPSVPPVVWCVWLCRRILADRMSHHGECKWAVYVPLVRVARSGCLSERVSAVSSAVVSQGVGFRRASGYVCMFGILVPVGILER